jgi:UDP-glucose 4-epimerase
MSNKKILITGGEGFIGSHLRDKLVENGNKVTVVDNKNKTGLDICDDRLFDVFEDIQPEVIFHFAAQTNVRVSNEQPAQDASVNIMGSLNVLDAARKVGVKKIVFASSAAVYGEASTFPTPEDAAPDRPSPYGIAKATTEKYLAYYSQSLNLPFVALRFANVYGPRQHSTAVIGSFFESILSEKEISIHGNGEQTRDFVFVGDVVRVSILAAQSSAIGAYNIGTEKETSLNELLKIIEDITQRKAKVHYEREKSGGQQRSSLLIGKAKKELKWEPSYTLAHGLEETFEWYKQQLST